MAAPEPLVALHTLVARYGLNASGQETVRVMLDGHMSEETARSVVIGLVAWLERYVKSRRGVTDD